MDQSERDIFSDIDYYNDLFNLGSGGLNLNVPLRYLRDMQDPYTINGKTFKMRYRFSQETVKNVILPIVLDDLQKIDRRGLPLAPELQILVCLRFYATASFQIVCGDLLYVSQPSVSNIVSRISNLLAQKHRQYITYPSDMTSHRLKFSRLGQYGQHAGLSNVDGAIDCTHIKIVSTPGLQHHEVFRNRKSYFSINVQAVVGPSGEFLDLVARWAGSTHDSRIFQLSNLINKYTQGTHTGKLVGDSGYPCLPFLLTPINSPTQPAEEVYNKVHAKTRNIVERTFGQWKKRFPCLQRGLGNKLTTVSNIIVACAILHNIGHRLNDEISAADDDLTDEVHNVEGSADGFAIRAAIVNNYV